MRFVATLTTFCPIYLLASIMARVTAIGIKKRKYVASDPSESPFAAQDAAAAAASAASGESPAAAPSVAEAAALKPTTESSQPVASTSTAASGAEEAVEGGEPSVKKHKKQHRGTRGRKHKLPEKASPTLALLAASAPSAIAAATSSSSARVPPPRADAASVRPPKGMTGSNEGAKGDSGWGARTQAPTFNAEGRKTMAGLEGPKPSESQVGYEARVAAREARKAGIKSGKGGASAVALGGLAPFAVVAC